MLVSITTRSPSVSLQIKGLASKYTTVKWPVGIGSYTDNIHTVTQNSLNTLRKKQIHAG